MKKSFLFLILFFTIRIAYGQEVLALEEIFNNPETLPVQASCEHLEPELAWDCTANILKEYTSNPLFPAKYATLCIETIIYIAFFVEIDGSISEITILSGFNEEFDAEAINLIKKMPKFVKPAYFNKKAVRTRLILPIRYGFY